MTRILCTFVVCALLVISAAEFDDYDYDSSEEDDKTLEPCDSYRCLRPNCSCFGTIPPNGMDPKNVPQFVMLSFDDAITVANVPTYRTIQGTRKNKGNGCPISMTFFVCHEYNDYEITNELYTKGNEIGVHSITHESDTDLWKFSTIERWTNEMVGMREILQTFGGIPKSAIRGHRAPFLQTAGNETFKMLLNNGFLYDSSMPTLSYMKPPIWPYTLDYGYPQDCQIRPCPTGVYPGIWEVPMVQYKRETIKEGITTKFHCSMADACTPYPETADDTKKYLMENFERHYKSNKAPFPVFLHEAWLRNDERLKGYLAFIDEVSQRDDVFLVTIQEMLDFVRNPMSLEEYKKKECFSGPPAGDCSEPNNCNFPKRNRFMKSCVRCPRRYPWLKNPLGLVIKPKSS